MVPIQLKNLIPVGTAIRNVRNEKNGSSTWPVANMWCAHTVMDSAAMPMVAATMPLYPNSGLRLNTAIAEVLGLASRQAAQQRRQRLVAAARARRHDLDVGYGPEIAALRRA